MFYTFLIVLEDFYNIYFLFYLLLLKYIDKKNMKCIYDLQISEPTDNSLIHLSSIEGVMETSNPCYRYFIP